MRYVRGFVMLLGVLPLSAQAWDLRVELPFLDGQDLPATQVQGAGPLSDEGLGRDSGLLLSLNHRLVRVNPVLRLDWGVELTQLQSRGHFSVGSAGYSSKLRQTGAGVGVTAQFWLPFTGAAGELSLIQRFQDYRFEAAGQAQDHALSRTWVRAGVRWRLPMPEVSPYLAASYQQALSPSHPVHRDTTPDLASYLAIQDKGQEFERMWTFGVGVQF